MNPGAYIALFGAGVASFANPCVLPLVPAYLGMIAGDEPHVSPHRRLVGTVVFVAGFTAVFAGLGVVAEIAGRNVDELLSSIQRVGGVVIIVLGFIQLGAIRSLRTKSWHLNTRLPIGVPFIAASLALESAPSLNTRLRSLGRALHYLAGVTLIVLGVLLATDRYNSLTSLLARVTAT